MQKRRISGAKSKTRRTRTPSSSRIQARRFLGLHLSGGKGGRTALVALDYFEKQNKLFLTHTFEQIQAEGDVSSDQILFEVISQNSDKTTEFLCIDAPLKLPKCITCRLKCPGFDECHEPEILWFWKNHRKAKASKPRKKLFTPYTQRVSESYIANHHAEDLPTLECLGSNTAPLTARAQFLARRLSHLRLLEAYPALSVLRIGQDLKIAKSHLLHYKHLVGGDESRQIILDQILNEDRIFIYQQDYQRLISNLDLFEAMFCAYTAYLKFKKLCEIPPKDLPLKQGWIEVPLKNEQKKA